MSSSTTESPDTWAQGKRAKLQAYASGKVGEWTRRALPVIAPGSFVCSWLGVFANGSEWENTTGWITGSASERETAARERRTPIRTADTTYDPNDASLWSNRGFHELGVGGVTGGSARGAAPSGGAWMAGASAADVRAVLGRAANTAPGAWRAPAGIPDQVVLAMWSLRNHAVEVARVLGGAVRGPRAVLEVVDGKPATPWSQWTFALATMGWSAGSTGAANHLRPYLAELVLVEPALRFSRWTELLVERGRPGRARSHGNAFYSCLRTWQKFQAGVIAAPMTGEGAAGARFTAYAGRDRDRVFEALTRGALGGSSGSSSSPSSSSRSSSSPSVVRRVLKGAAVVATLGVVGRWAAHRWMERGFELAQV
jgi:hypothetical protein